MPQPQIDMSSPEDTQTTEVLKPVPLLENDGTLDQQLEACRSVLRHAAACRSEPKFSWGLVKQWREFLQLLWAHQSWTTSFVQATRILMGSMGFLGRVLRGRVVHRCLADNSSHGVCKGCAQCNNSLVPGN